MRISLIAACLGGVLLAGCGGRDDASGRGPDGATSAGADALPAPERSRGGVTGMPDSPGPGGIGPLDDASFPSAEPTFDSDGNPIPPDADLINEPVEIADDYPPSAPVEPVPDSGFEPGPQEAASVVRDYYGAINGGSMAAAYRLWSNDGRASGQSPQQFADGFAQTAAVSVEIMQPGRIDAATGARYIEVPVAVAATQRDGSIRRYVGAYTLRRSVVDGASAEQRAWRITSADIREVRQ